MMIWAGFGGGGLPRYSIEQLPRFHGNRMSSRLGVITLELAEICKEFV